MELTANQMLLRGVTAHREGKLQEAERCYRAILNAQPSHPDANHNLGLLAVSVGKPEKAIGFFEKAIEGMPKSEQFWRSYIDALAKINQFESARKAMRDAQQAGISLEKIRGLLEGHHLDTKSIGEVNEMPPQEQLAVLLELYEQGHLNEAEKLASSITQQYPGHQFGWKVLASVLKKSGRVDQSLFAAMRSVSLAPEDASALYNLGNTYLQLGKLGEAAESFRKAVAVEPELAEAYFGLGNTLRVLGNLSEAETNLRQSINLRPDSAKLHHTLGLTLKEMGNLNDAAESFGRAVKLEPHQVEGHHSLATTLAAMGRLDEAVVSFMKALELAPNSADLHCNLGSALSEIGRLGDAEECYRKAIGLRPAFAEAHCNLGNVYRDLDKLNESQASLLQAIELKPDLAEAHNSMGMTLSALSRLEEAKESYHRALALKPDLAAASNNLGATLKELGQLGDAVTAFAKAIALKPDAGEFYSNLAETLRGLVFTSPAPQLYPVLTTLITTRSEVRPRDIRKSVISLLKHDPLIVEILNKKNSSDNIEEIEKIVKALDQIPLLHELMRVCPINDLQFEMLFSSLRQGLILSRDKVKVESWLVNFHCTLALHGFINEYVYPENDEEILSIDELESDISEAVLGGGQPRFLDVLLLASYRALCSYDWAKKIKFPDQYEPLRTILIDEPLIERELKKNISSLGKITDAVSLKVGEQYEQNPYPRWVKTALPPKSISLATYCDRIELRFEREFILELEAPEILIAGCGTGQHSIGTAAKFLDCKVTAVDLSLSSLAYAIRKTNDLDIKNLEYLQADILDLPQLNRRFDLIEAMGVLHHMGEPLVGWRVLTDLLRPGGLMKVGLYSLLARRSIVAVRDKIASLKIGESEAEIRRFRQTLIKSREDSSIAISKISDFYSMSEVRDLIFHRQEHRFTIPAIRQHLDELGLRFCGFESAEIVKRFRSFIGDKADIYDLNQWHGFEEGNPGTFIGMYQFWCQKI